MLEVLLVLFVAIAIFVFDNIIFSVLALFFVLLLVGPGLYSMLSGAPFVPTTKKTMDQIVEFAEIDQTSRVVDLGCGDGRLIQKIAEMGPKRAVGYEFSSPTYLAARLRKIISGTSEEILYKNIWSQNYKNFDVLLCFLMRVAMKRFEKEIWPNLEKGTRVVSNTFKMPNHKPYNSKNGVHLYIKK